MVDITDFFGRGKKSTAKATTSKERKPARAATAPTPEPQHDIIDLDDEDDDDLLELQPSRKRALTKTEPETITLDTPPQKKKRTIATVIDDDEDEESKQEVPLQESIITKPLPVIPVTHKKVPKPAPVDMEVKSEKKSEKKSAPVPVAKSDISAEEVLATITSLDLSTVHVKEGANFNFRARGSGDMDEGTGETPSDFPEGAPNCLLGLTIVFTGVLPTIERGAAESLAKRYGARVTKSISGKTSVVVLGDDAGPKKLEKIKQLKVKAIDEDGFKQLISGMPAAGGSGVIAEKARLKLEEEEEKTKKEVEAMMQEEKLRESRIKKAKQAGETIKQEDKIREEDKLWTVKYAPTSLSQICGNKGPVTKLTNWLKNWDANKKLGFKSPGRDGTGIFRTVMLSGPPGIGKTTAAHLIANQFGYDVLEQNASDVRSKSLLNAGVKNALGNMSVIGYFKNKDNVDDINGKKFVIIMDEVDGMSGGDRGGVGQLAQFCRKTTTPMILICNERNLPKMRPFDRTCLDIQFRRPDANSVKARLMTIAVREGFKLDPTIVDKLVQTTRGDIRQIINLLSTISKTTKSIGHENIQEISKAWEKNVALKPFDITHKMFDGHIYTSIGSNTFTLNDKIALYFDDFDFTPLMIQENYIHCKPANLPPGKSPLEAIADAADSISQGDLVERKIRSSEQLWSLLPLHAVLSSVRPASKVAGHMSGRINFTGWLGQNSKTNKYFRLLQELQYHMRLSTSTDKLGLRLSYLPTLKDRMLLPLVKEGTAGVDEIIKFMDDYYLTKEDWDTVMEFMVGPDKTDVTIKKIPSSVKSAFTRKYNGMTHPVAIYKTGSSVGGGGAVSKPDFEDIVDADTASVAAEDENNEDDGAINLKKDKLIKQKARPTKRKAATTKKDAPKKRKTKA
ncbi:replication factor C subunit 1 [Monosporozyma servazzii]